MRGVRTQISLHDEAVLAAAHKFADENGELGRGIAGRIAVEAQMGQGVVNFHIQRLTAQGALKRYGRGLYRLPGGKRPRRPFPEPKVIAGIETTTYYVVNRNSTANTDGLPLVPITLPRIPSLERPLPSIDRIMAKREAA